MCGNIPLTLLEDKEHVEIASFKNFLLPCNRIKSWFFFGKVPLPVNTMGGIRSVNQLKCGK